MGRILLLAAQLLGQWKSISTELSSDRHRGWPPHPSRRSTGCSAIIEEREISWSWQHPNRTGPSRWRGRNHRSHDNLQQTGEWSTPWTQSLVVTLPKKGNLQQCQNYWKISFINHPSKVIRRLTEATSEEDHRWRKGRLQSRKEHHRADLHPTNPRWEIFQNRQDLLLCLRGRERGGAGTTERLRSCRRRWTSSPQG